jgi:hypothetical protein
MAGIIPRFGGMLPMLAPSASDIITTAPRLGIYAAIELKKIQGI